MCFVSKSCDKNVQIFGKYPIIPIPKKQLFIAQLEIYLGAKVYIKNSSSVIWIIIYDANLISSSPEL